MRSLLLAALLGVLLLAPVTAQMDFAQPYQVRGALGDIPSTAAKERDGVWNVEQLLKVTHLNGTAQSLHFNLPTGAALETFLCSCPHASEQTQGEVVIVTLAPDNPSGPTDVRVVSSQPYGAVLGFSLRAPAEAGPDAAVIFYVPGNNVFDAPAPASSPGSSTNGQATIQVFSFNSASPMGSPFWVTIHQPTTPATTTTTASPGIPWVYLVVGLGAGALLWAGLVSQGIVQKRARKQTANVAAHTESAANDTPAVLEGKKRALLAALKDVEMAKQNSEMDNATYDAVKAEFKKQAVTVMRALDEGSAKKA